MDQAEIERKFRHIEVWKRGSERAPHKPLLLLYALGRAGRNNDRLMLYSEVDGALHELLKEFGPHRRSIHTEYPFWRLQNDGIWQIAASTALERGANNAEPKKSELLKHGVQGGFPPDIWAALQQDPSLALALAHIILDMNFPPSLHDDLLSATGLDGDMARVEPKYRDPQFRMRVLTAYEHCCAICGFDVRLGSIQLGLDAAHIMWHQAGGPDVVQNGLALCTLHHKLFDRGAFTLSPNYTVQLSERLHGSNGFETLFLKYHGQRFRQPQSPGYWPALKFLHWHHTQVFQGPARYVSARVTELEGE